LIDVKYSIRNSRPLTRPAVIAGVVLACLLVFGCGRNEVTHFRVPKGAPAAPPSSALPPGMQPAGLEGASGAAQGNVLRWTLPKGWTETLVGGMRYATLTPPVQGRMEVSVVVLPGPAGGELANVNRWRSQIGLAPIDEPGLAAARKQLTAKLGPIAVYDFANDGSPKSRVIAALTSAEGKTWFVKMTGDAGPVGDARPDFLRLLESLRLDRPN
jgi:hypothetical protein